MTISFFNRPKLDHLLICCTHHKSGTSLMVKIMNAIAHEYNMKIQMCNQNDLENDCQIWVDWHSHVNFADIQRAYRGIHIIRDPIDMIVSGYFYHKRCSEEWCLIPWPCYGGLSYRENLTQLNQDDGLMFEMHNQAKSSIENISRWNYKNPNIFEVKFEKIMKDYEEVFSKVFRFFGFSKKGVKKCTKLSGLYNLKNYSQIEIKKMNHVHSTELQKWKKFFNKKHKDTFKELFGDVLVRLGYEKNNDW